MSGCDVSFVDLARGGSGGGCAFLVFGSGFATLGCGDVIVERATYVKGTNEKFQWVALADWLVSSKF